MISVSPWLGFLKITDPNQSLTINDNLVICVLNRRSQIDQILLWTQANDLDGGGQFLARVGGGCEMIRLFQPVGAAARQLGAQDIGYRSTQQAARQATRRELGSSDPT